MEVVFEVFVLLTGRLAICIATLGSCRFDSLFGDDHLIHCAAGALWYTRDGRSVVTTTGQSLAGFAFYIALVLGLVGLAMG